MRLHLSKRLLFGGGALFLGSIIAAGVLWTRTPVVISDSSKLKSQMAPIETTQNESSSAVTKLDDAATNTQALTPPGADPELKPFENKTELSEFKILKQKVFLTEEEKQLRQNFLKNRALLENLKGLFKYPTAFQDLESQQNVAVDLLLEAIKSGDAETARSVLRELIADPTIEDKQLSPVQRQNLAGVKAEVLYQWSSLEPDRAGEMQKVLPGPVSQKIWKNVLTQQDLNRAESAITK